MGDEKYVELLSTALWLPTEMKFTHTEVCNIVHNICIMKCNGRPYIGFAVNWKTCRNHTERESNTLEGVKLFSIDMYSVLYQSKHAILFHI